MTAPQSNQREDWIQVAEVGQVWQAELIAGRLRASGIDAEIVDQTFHQEPVPNVRAFAVVRVFVRMEQLAETNRLLDQALDLPDDADVTSTGGNGEPRE